MADESADKIQLTRRQAVAALGAGVVVVGGAAAATAAVVNSQNADAARQIQALEAQLADLTTKHDAAQKQNAALQQQYDETQKQLTVANIKLDGYMGLVALYETLDKIGIDTVVAGALNAYKGTLDALGAGIETLRAGIVTAENALTNFESTFASVRSALDAAEQEWANVEALLKNAQDLIKNATSPLLPFVDQATKFFNDLLGKIPFGAGDSARQTINGVIGLMAAVPGALDELGNGLFKTLRDGWFSDDTARNLQTTLAKPITDGVLEPARRFLDQTDTALKSWESEVATPIHNSLAQRQVVQQQIADYKSKNGM